MTFPSKLNDQSFANDAGVTPQLVSDDDPYRLLDELMFVVEALCVRFPALGPADFPGLGPPE